MTSIGHVGCLGGLNCDGAQSEGAEGTREVHVRILSALDLSGGGGEAWLTGPSAGLSQTAHLRRFVRNQDALSPCDGVLHVLGVVVPLHTDQVAWRGHLAWKGHPLCHQMLTNWNQKFFFSWGKSPQRERHRNRPSLNSRLSSWFGQRFTTSVTCSAFL